MSERVIVFVDYENLRFSARDPLAHLVRLLPALETVTELGLARVEVAAWRKSSRLNFPGQRLPWCHQLDAGDYAAVRDSTDYLKDRG